ncbi:hypothetical protein B0J11DRAFT_42747 [Dendryphion nanum]|uniref:RNA helicase HEL117 n=1 Tax=Dendryphion nanum TaxID=256645 RepID=A0A9P9J285_9PLEO|nr:hypothetical protein B0J11DRAFT_42747 [Dendryphion nanum]
MPTNERSRSRSPYRSSGKHRHRDRHTRSRSPQRDGKDRHHHHKRRRTRSRSPRAVVLPYNAKQLSKHNFDKYKPLFQSYLDIQKQIDIEELDEREVRGRWKSFVSRWNRGELARSWYDPSMLKTAQETIHSPRASSPKRKSRSSPERKPYQPSEYLEDPQSDDDFGPAPPDNVATRRSGPTIPGMEDLALRNEEREEDRIRNRSNYVEDIRHQRKADRSAQKERLEELVPRADPGSRARQLEKKQDTTSTLKDFRDAKEGGDAEVRESDLMGDDGIEAYKRQKTEGERRKNEREIRKEEILRARAAEREERLSERRTKEAQTMDYLRQIAKDRFG